MIDPGSILPLYNAKEKNEVNEIMNIVEAMYLENADRYYSAQAMLETFAKEIFDIEKRIRESNSIYNLQIRSRSLRENELLKEYSREKKLSTEQIDLIQAKIIDPNRSYISALFIKKILDQKRDADRQSWTRNALLAIIIALLGIIAKGVFNG